MFGLVLLDGLVHVREEIGPEAVQVLAVVPRDHDGAQGEPEDQAERGLHGFPGEAGVALCPKVQDRPGAGHRGVVARPYQGKLVASGQHDQRVGGGMPVAGDGRMGDGEIESRMRRRASLRTWRQIAPSDQVQAPRVATLPMRHM